MFRDILRRKPRARCSVCGLRISCSRSRCSWYRSTFGRAVHRFSVNSSPLSGCSRFFGAAGGFAWKPCPSQSDYTLLGHIGSRRPWISFGSGKALILRNSLINGIRRPVQTDQTALPDGITCLRPPMLRLAQAARIHDKLFVDHPLENGRWVWPVSRTSAVKCETSSHQRSASGGQYSCKGLDGTAWYRRNPIPIRLLLNLCCNSRRYRLCSSESPESVKRPVASAISEPSRTARVLYEPDGVVGIAADNGRCFCADKSITSIGLGP